MVETSPEGARILAENARRRAEIPTSRYAPWEPGELFLRHDRSRVALCLLARVGRLPASIARALEVGCGTGGWLPELLSWGLSEGNLAGLDLDAGRIDVAHARLPAADLRVGDATALPWHDASFDLIVISTVFSSILDRDVQVAIADQITRALAASGAVVWYDLALDNPNNRNVRAISSRQLATLFPQLKVTVRRCGLLPPLARWLAPRSHTLATLAATLPPLRSHLLGILTHP